MSSSHGYPLFSTKIVEQLRSDSDTVRFQAQPGRLRSVLLGIGASSAPASSCSRPCRRRQPGPAVALSFTVPPIASAFAGSATPNCVPLIPIAGSAYTYAYATMGELVRLIIAGI